MAVKYVVCTSTAQALELYEAGLLWVNQDSSKERAYTNWHPASQCHKLYCKNIDLGVRNTEPHMYWCTDFAYALED